MPSTTPPNLSPHVSSEKRGWKNAIPFTFRRQTNVAVNRWKRKRENGPQRTVFWEWNSNGWPSDVTMCVCGDCFIRKWVEAATCIDPERAGGRGSGSDQSSLRRPPGALTSEKQPMAEPRERKHKLKTLCGQLWGFKGITYVLLSNVLQNGIGFKSWNLQRKFISY